MRMYDIIHKKRDGYELTKEEIGFFIDGYTKGIIPDYQASALCMAIYFKGMTDEETVNLTSFMATSGDVVDLSRFGDLTIDKHSTGGVGDKTSLIICPIVSSLGGKMAKMTGRGLGHTGGTADKLESIPGFHIGLDGEEFLKQVEDIGLAVVGQSANLTPADKKLYALRDVTATVESIPLITSSIMSKKLAAGSKNIVLDVKVGSGAFMKNLDDARDLANHMVKIGKECDRNVTALLTNMDCPLGNNVGNSLEVQEAIDVLKNGKKGDLYTVCVSLATEMVSLALKISTDEARSRVIDAIESGKAYRKMIEWIGKQGGDVSYIENPEKFPKASFAHDVICDKDGYIDFMDAETIGNTASILGAGRISKEDSIDYSAGIIIAKKTGDKVNKGNVLATLYTNKEETLSNASDMYLSSLKITEEEPEKPVFVYDIIR